MPSHEPRTRSLLIDGRKAYFPEGVTVQRAAELNGVAIPSLCSHKDLSPFGGCRLCVVEIEGRRGFPLACQTTAEDGMVVRTETETLRDLRREYLKLILSEHPSSCLVCDEKDACRDFQGTIRKAGVTTGCRFCPNDGQCELQDLVDRIGLTEIDYPVFYHGYEPEHDDPFYDRDYNLCILCGRCVRMCQEVRGTGVLAFTHRGPQAKIGPAFGRSHREAGCEFCGACVDVCPTGALADKASKWDGKPDGRQVSTCPFCPIGCQIELSHKNGRLSKARALADPEVNDGQLCVKGRFCLPETTHHFSRARKPMVRKGDYFREVSWPEAVERVAGELKKAAASEVLTLVSPDLTNESLFAAQRLVRDVLGGRNIDSTARLAFPGGLSLWSRLFARPISIKAIARADAILAIGLDSRFHFSVIGTKVRQALQAGARLVTIDCRESNLARYTEEWLRPAAGGEGRLLRVFADRLAGRAGDIPAAAREASVEAGLLESALDAFSSAESVTVIIGPRLLRNDPGVAAAEAVAALAALPELNLVPLYFGANARGALEMGVFPDLGPGAAPLPREGSGLAELAAGACRPKVLYLVGDTPFTERPECDFVVVQDLYLPPFPVDAFLPASSFAEAGGTIVNIEGRVQEIVQIENQPEGAVTGFMRPDWLIFSDLAASLGGEGLNYRTAEDVRRDIRRAVPDFPPGPSRKARRLDARGLADSVTAARPEGAGDFLLIEEPRGFVHRGVDLASKVEGLGELALEEGFRMSPEDLEALGLRSGDLVRLAAGPGDGSVTGAVSADTACPRGAIFRVRPFAGDAFGLPGPGPARVKLEPAEPRDK